MAATKTKSTRKTARKPPSGKVDDKEQYERFRSFPREVEADNNPDVFDHKFRQIVPPKSGRN